MSSKSSKLFARLPLAVSVLSLCAAAAPAAPPEPVYSASFSDCVTGPNAFASGGYTRWSVSPGCDSYQNDRYERPVTQTFECAAGRYGARYYHENLDIAAAEAGVAGQFMFVAIRMHGIREINDVGAITNTSLRYEYSFRMSNDPDGRFGYKFLVDSPFDASSTPTVWNPVKTFGHRDTDGDVGGAADSGPTGLNVTKSDNPAEEAGMNGFDRVVVSDGRTSGRSGPVLWARLRPGNPAVVEFALDYGAFGFTAQQVRNLPYLVFEANKGLQDAQNHLWNDKYTGNEAGSPNRGVGSSCLSEFGTQGLGNIYELDTLSGGPIGPCDGDLNGDGTVTVQDLFLFLEWFFAGDLRADLNGDGRVTVGDLLKHFLPEFFDPDC